MCATLSHADLCPIGLMMGPLMEYFIIYNNNKLEESEQAFHSVPC